MKSTSSLLALSLLVLPALASAENVTAPAAPAKPAASDEMDFSIQPVPQAQFDSKPPAPMTLPAPDGSPSRGAATSGSNGTSIPVSGNSGGRPAAGSADASKYFDQFFSTTTVLPPEPAPAAESAPPPPEPTVQPRKTARKKTAPALPPYNYRTSHEPQPVYAKAYTKKNQHLPIAIYQSDLQNLLPVAVLRDNVEQLRSLAQRGADIRLPTASGESLVVLATRNNRLDTLRWLLQHGVAPDTTDSRGETALHYAAFSNNHAAANLLLQYGANVNAADTQGQTALAIATWRGSANAATVLRSFGANG